MTRKAKSNTVVTVKNEDPISMEVYAFGAGRNIKSGKGWKRVERELKRLKREEAAK